jgi:hypothetical protein
MKPELHSESQHGWPLPPHGWQMIGLTAAAPPCPLRVSMNCGRHVSPLSHCSPTQQNSFKLPQATQVMPTQVPPA